MPAQARRRGRREEGPEFESGRREAILEAALGLFAKYGFDATSTARIATEANVPTGLVFYYFPSKIDLLLAIVRERATMGDQFLLKPSGQLAGDVLSSTVDLIGRIRGHLTAQRDVILVVFMEVGRHPEVRDQARALRAATTEAIARALTDALPDTHERSEEEDGSRRRRLLATAQLLAPALVIESVLDPDHEALNTEAIAEVVAAAMRR